MLLIELARKLLNAKAIIPLLTYDQGFLTPELGKYFPAPRQLLPIGR